MLPYVSTDDAYPKVDRIPEQVLVEAGYHSPSPLLPPPPPPQPHSVQPVIMPLLTEEQFMDAFVQFSDLTGIKLNEQDFFIEGHQVNPWDLYRTVSLRNGFDSVTMNGEWSMVGVDLGFPPVSCGDPHPLAHCTPVVAHQLHQLYQDTLRHFDQAYNRGTINQNQLEYLDRPQALQGHYQPLAHQPTEADFHTLLATIAASESSPFQTFEDAKNILPMFCDVSAAELGAHRVPQHVIAYVEHNREYLKRLAQNPRSFTGFTPVGSPQSVHQNPFRVNDVQATPDPSLHFPQSRPQMQGGGMNLSLPQQQTILALRNQVLQGKMTQQQALDRLATIQASAHPFQDQSVPQQLPPGFNAGAMPTGATQQQIAALSQRPQVSANNQINTMQRVIQTQDPSLTHQFNMFLPGQQQQRQQQQNGSGIASRMGQYLNPSGMGLWQGPDSLQQDFIQPSPSAPHANSQPSTPSASQIPQPGTQQVSGLADVPLPQLRVLSTHLQHVVVEGEKNLQAISSSGEGDSQRQQIRAKIELNKQRLRILHEAITMKLRASGDPTQQTVNGPSWPESGQRSTELYPVAERPGQHNSLSAPQSNLTQISSRVSANDLPSNSIFAQINDPLQWYSPQTPQPPIQPNDLHYLSEDRFNSSFMQFTRSKGIRLSERDLVFDGRQINLWALHRAVFSRNGFESVSARDEWPVVGVALGFPPVAGGDPGRPPRCGPVIAQRLQQLYDAVLRHFDQVYISSMAARLRSSQASGQLPPQPPQTRAQPRQPTEAAYQALLASINSETSVMNIQTMCILPQFSHTPGVELEAHHVPQHVITFVELNREILQRAVQDNGYRAADLTFLPGQQLERRGLVQGPDTLQSAQQFSRGPLFPPSMTQMINGSSVQSMGAQIPGPNSSSGVQNLGGTVPISMNPAAMNGVTPGSILVQPASTMQVRRLNQEDLVAAKRWIEEKKRIAFSSVPSFDRVPLIQSIPESDIQEYQRNLERLDQVLVNIEKYIHFAFAALKKEEIVERLFNMMASAKSQLEELKKPNARYVLELHTIRGMIQEADNMDKGLKAVLQRTQALMAHSGVPSEGEDSESALSPEEAVSHREGLFDEEVRIAMSKLEI